MYAFEMDKQFFKVTKDALSYPSKCDYEATNDEHNHASFYLGETGLTELAHRGTKEEMFEQNIVKFTKRSPFLDASLFPLIVFVCTPSGKFYSCKD